MSTRKQLMIPGQWKALAPRFHSPAVERCCVAWNHTYKTAVRKGVNPVRCYLLANEAYQMAMPPLDSPENIRDFLACVTHSMLAMTLPEKTGMRLLYAAQVATGVFNAAAKTPRDVTPKPSRETQKGAKSTPPIFGL